MSRPYLLIRADASPRIGTGHIMRCLALAQAWQTDVGQACFLTSSEIAALEDRLRVEGFEVLLHTESLGGQKDAENTVAVARDMAAKVIVVDGYHFDATYQRRLKTAGFRVLVVDDNAHADHYFADWVLNQNIYAHEGLYTNREPYTQLLLGTRYALLRREFWLWRGWQRQIEPVGRKVLVTLGGSDPDNVTLKVIQALQQVELPDLEAIVVVGGSNPHFAELQAAIKTTDRRIILQRNVTDMPKLIAWADMAIAAGGSTCWELAFMGLPGILIVLAKNQELLIDRLHMLGAFKSLGWYHLLKVSHLSESLKRLVLSFEYRQSMYKACIATVDGVGSFRTICSIC